jgi:glycerol uptake facilitator-like aquaporin
VTEAARASLGRRLVAEGLGTAILVATVVGSGIMAERLAGGNQAIALLGNTIPTGAILVVIITILGPISGAHFNPAVTLVFAARRELPWGAVAPYIVVQCLGAIAGTALAHLMFDLAPFAVGTTVRSGRRSGSPRRLPPSRSSWRSWADYGSRRRQFRGSSASPSPRPIGSRRRPPSPIPP